MGHFTRMQFRVVSVLPWTANREVRSSNPGYQWEEETVMERTGHGPPSYAVAQKMKSLTRHTHGCLRTIYLKGLLFSSSL